jgi:hypothetical protein
MTHACCQVYGGINDDNVLFGDLWMIDTMLTRPEWKQLATSGLSPVARYGMGMVALEDAIAVFGGLAHTPGTGALRSNALWVLSMRENSTRWTQIIAEAAANAVRERSHFAMASIGGTLVISGGSGNFGVFDDMQQIDMCRIKTCRPGYKVVCDWNPFNMKRGVCIPCEPGEFCCRAATYEATTGLCSGINITLSSCAQSDSQWHSLMQALAPSVYPDASDCKRSVQEMCQSISSPGIQPGKASDNPLICDKVFLCSSDSPFGSLKFAPTNVCGLKDATCKAAEVENNVCCSYIEYLISQSCSSLPEAFVGFLARSRFPSCKETKCYDPAQFQATRVAVASSRPSWRDGMRAAVVGTSVFMFGGLTSKAEFSSELWELQSHTFPPSWISWDHLRAAPSGRRDAAVAALEPSARILVHGGEGPRFLLDDLYVLDTLAGTAGSLYKWTALKAVVTGDVPTERTLHAMVGASATDAYLFGGKTLYGLSSEVFSRSSSTYLHETVPILLLKTSQI